jgi:hypothetical protein
VFDNDGTLWAEQPMYVHLFFIVDRIKTLAPTHPEWRTTEPFAAVLKGDLKTALAGGERGIAALRIQDLHRLGRRHRIHPAVGRGGLRNSLSVRSRPKSAAPITHVPAEAGGEQQQRQPRRLGRHEPSP